MKPGAIYIMREYKTNNEFWVNLDSLIHNSKVVIDRPKGSSHPKYPGFIYPVDYGYLQSTKSNDGNEIDIWVGSGRHKKVIAVMCIVDIIKKDSEIKILYACLEKELNKIYKVHNEKGMKGILIKRKL
jgi:inorganic pyrophosphatase